MVEEENFTLLENHGVMTMTSRPYRCWRPTLRPGVVLCVILIFVSCQMYIMQSSLIRKDIVKPKEKNKMSNPEVTRDVNKRLLLQPGPIFYNLFVPPNNVKNTQRIVKEQIQERNWTSPNATILYTLIGDASFQNYVTSLCQHSDDEMSSSSSSSCILREHIPSYGDEQHTLQSLWEYCQQQTRTFDNQDIFVTYIHDKGSFHATEANEKARRMATKGALDCRNVWPQAKHPRSCNICMGAFHIFPQYLASAK